MLLKKILVESIRCMRQFDECQFDALLLDKRSGSLID
jgi:hypothetical protein